MIRYLVMLVAVTLVAASAVAADCPVTSKIPARNYPGAELVPSGNNLLQPAGKALVADGQRVVILGQVLDKHCLPVKQAMVEIWQVDPFGQWLLAGPREQATPNASFAGAGRTYTDEQGHFMFITAFPAAVKDRAPSINVKVKAQGMADFNTALYFANDSRNADDKQFKKLSSDEQAAITLRMGQTNSGDLAGRITLVLPINAPYVTY